MNRLIKDKPIMDSKTPLYVGTISPGVAVDFVQFSKVYDSIPDIKTIINDPTGVAVPNDTATRWAVVSSLSSKATEEIFSPLCTYINRFGIEGKILFYRSVVARNPKLHGHPDFISAMGQLSRYLHGTDQMLQAA
jgi:hypothetical protein